MFSNGFEQFLKLFENVRKHQQSSTKQCKFNMFKCNVFKPFRKIKPVLTLFDFKTILNI